MVAGAEPLGFLLAQVALLTTKKPLASAKKDLTTGQDVAAGVNLARDLSNEPPNKLYPATLAQAAVEMAKGKALNTYPSYLMPDGSARKVARGTTVRIRLSLGP